jgi:hypothetical protein
VNCPHHPPKTEQVLVRMTPEERKMLRTMGVRHAAGSDQGFIRHLIREAWERRERRERK